MCLAGVTIQDDVQTFLLIVIYFIEISRETLPGNYLISKAKEFAEFLIELLKKIVSTKL